MKKLFPALFVALALAVSGFGAVSVSSPFNGQVVSPSTHFVASASSSNPITGMVIYLDNNSIYSTSSGSIDQWITLPAGTHYIVVQAWDSTGAYWKAPLTVTVGSPPTDSTPVSVSPVSSPAPALSGTIADIDQMPGWESCTVCAGAGGNGPVAEYSTTQYRASPSMDGASQEFWIGGNTPYSSALWWKQLGPNDNASHFVYDVYFYLVNPNAPQALEFDVNQSVGGKKYIFGTECDYRGTRVWRVWDAANGRWVQTGIGCSTPTGYTWHHLTLEFARTDNGQAMFVSLTLDGAKSYINQSFWPISIGANELNVAFQMDGNYAQTPHSVWLDKLNLSAW